MDLTVADLVQRFGTGEIRLPLMQRDYVWKPKKVVRLLDSGQPAHSEVDFELGCRSRVCNKHLCAE